MTIEVNIREMEVLLNCVEYALKHHTHFCDDKAELLALYGKLVDVQDVYINRL